MTNRLKILAFISSITALTIIIVWLTRPSSHTLCAATSIVKRVDTKGLVERPLTDLCRLQPWRLTKFDHGVLRSVQMASDSATLLLYSGGIGRPSSFGLKVDFGYPQKWSVYENILTVGIDIAEDPRRLTKVLLAAQFFNMGRRQENQLYTSEIFADIYEGLIAGTLNDVPLETISELNFLNLPLKPSEQNLSQSISQMDLNHHDLRTGALAVLKRKLKAGLPIDERFRLAKRLWNIIKFFDSNDLRFSEDEKIESFQGKLNSVSEIFFTVPVDFEESLLQEFESQKLVIRSAGKYSVSALSRGYMLSSRPSALAEIWIQQSDPSLIEIAVAKSRFLILTPVLTASHFERLKSHFNHSFEIPRPILKEMGNVSVWSPEATQLALQFGLPSNLHLPADQNKLSKQHRFLLGIGNNKAGFFVDNAPIQALVMVIEDKQHAR